MYDKLVAKVNNVDTSKFALKTKYDTYKSNLKKENKWCRKKDYNAKIYEIEDKIPSITGLATTAALTAVENKIPDIINLVKKKTTNYDAKIESKYFTSTDYNKFTSQTLYAKIKQKELVDKSAIARFTNNDDKKVATLATKAELKAKQEKMTKV